MNTFKLQFQSSDQSQLFEKVSAFVGEDDSGSFGILAGHARFMTSLSAGLARFKVDKSDWTYIALPGAIIYFYDNQLEINCRYYLLEKSYRHITEAFEKKIELEKKNLMMIKKDFSQIEKALYKRLWHLNKIRSKGGAEMAYDI